MVGCKNYLANTLMHLAGGLGLVAATSRIPAAESALNALGNTGAAKWGLLAFYIVSLIGLVIAIRMVPVGGPAQYSLALVFVFIVGQTLKPLFDSLDQKDTLFRVFVLTTGLFVGMMLLALFGPISFLGLGGFLFAGLVGLLLAQLILAALEYTDVVNDTRAQKGDTFLSWIGVGLFTLYTAYDTQRIKKNASRCKGQADYIGESLGLFLDFINLFSNVADLVDE
jgi:FtsH-binding integral membrane protein